MSILRTAVQYGAINTNITNVEIDTAYDLGDGNHAVKVSGDKTSVKTGNGNSNIKSYGNNADVTTGNGNNVIVSYGDDSSITTGSGNQKITSIGDNKTIVTDSGDDDITFIGDGCTLNAGDGENKVIFWGNDTNITTGAGNDDIKTFDQVYDEEDLSDIAQAFLATLPTEIREEWDRIARHQIDYICQKSLMSKSQTWVYEDTYDVYTIFYRYINGLKNVNIDMGGGVNTASLTVDKETANIIDNGKSVLSKDRYGNIKQNETTGNITFNKNDSLDTVLDKRNETKLDVKTKSNTRWGGVFVAAAAAVAATVLTWGAALPYVISAASAAVTACDFGYKAATGQTLHTGDWVNAGAAALTMGGGGLVTIGGTMRGVYAASQGDWVTAGMNLLPIAGGFISPTVGNVCNMIGTGINIVDKGTKIAEGDAKLGDWLSLGLSAASFYGSYVDVTTPSTTTTDSSSNDSTNKTGNDLNGKEPIKVTPDKNGPATTDTNKDLGSYLAKPGDVINEGAISLGNKLGANGDNIFGNIVGGGVSIAGQIIGTPLSWAGEFIGDTASWIGTNGYSAYNSLKGNITLPDAVNSMNSTVNLICRNDEEYDDEPTLEW